MPALGEPVASMSTSTSGSSIMRRASSKNRKEAIAVSAQPTRRKASRARSGLRSAIATMRMPGVWRTWDRNIEPNLPAPISPIRSGSPRSSRCFSNRCKFSFGLRVASTVHRYWDGSDLASRSPSSRQ